MLFRLRNDSPYRPVVRFHVPAMARAGDRQIVLAPKPSAGGTQTLKSIALSPEAFIHIFGAPLAFQAYHQLQGHTEQQKQGSAEPQCQAHHSPCMDLCGLVKLFGPEQRSEGALPRSTPQSHRDRHNPKHTGRTSFRDSKPLGCAKATGISADTSASGQAAHLVMGSLGTKAGASAVETGTNCSVTSCHEAGLDAEDTATNTSTWQSESGPMVEEQEEDAQILEWDQYIFVLSPSTRYLLTTPATNAKAPPLLPGKMLSLRFRRPMSRTQRCHSVSRRGRCGGEHDATDLLEACPGQQVSQWIDEMTEGLASVSGRCASSSGCICQPGQGQDHLRRVRSARTADQGISHTLLGGGELAQSRAPRVPPVPKTCHAEATTFHGWYMRTCRGGNEENGGAVVLEVLDVASAHRMCIVLKLRGLSEHLVQLTAPLKGFELQQDLIQERLAPVLKSPSESTDGCVAEHQQRSLLCRNSTNLECEDGADHEAGYLANPVAAGSPMSSKPVLGTRRASSARASGQRGRVTAVRHIDSGIGLHSRGESRPCDNAASALCVRQRMPEEAARLAQASARPVLPGPLGQRARRMNIESCMHPLAASADAHVGEQPSRNSVTAGTFHRPTTADACGQGITNPAANAEPSSTHAVSVAAYRRRSGHSVEQQFAARVLCTSMEIQESMDNGAMAVVAPPVHVRTADSLDSGPQAAEHQSGAPLASEHTLTLQPATLSETHKPLASGAISSHRQEEMRSKLDESTKRQLLSARRRHSSAQSTKLATYLHAGPFPRLLCPDCPHDSVDHTRAGACEDGELKIVAAREQLSKSALASSVQFDISRCDITRCALVHLLVEARPLAALSPKSQANSGCHCNGSVRPTDGRLFTHW
jgi:hypothetical protein